MLRYQLQALFTTFGSCLNSIHLGIGVCINYPVVFYSTAAPTSLIARDRDPHEIELSNMATRGQHQRLLTTAVVLALISVLPVSGRLRNSIHTIATDNLHI